MDVIGMVLNIIGFIAVSAGLNIYAILMLVIVIPDFIAGVLCCRWLCSDGKDERKGLIWAFLIQIVCSLLLGVL